MGMLVLMALKVLAVVWGIQICGGLLLLWRWLRSPACAAADAARLEAERFRALAEAFFAPSITDLDRNALRSVAGESRPDFRVGRAASDGADGAPEAP